MTQTVRNFIGLEDLVALRLQCKECSATLTLPLSNQSLQRSPTMSILSFRLVSKARQPNEHE